MKKRLAAALLAAGLLSACANGYDPTWGWKSLCDKAGGEWADDANGKKECQGNVLELIFGEE